MSEQKKVNKKVGYYEDDYVEEFVIEETATLPEVRIKYRPLNMIQASKLTDEVMNGKTVTGATEATLKMLTKHIIDWDLQKLDDEKVDFTKFTELQKVDPAIMNKIAGAVRGDRKSPTKDIEDIKTELKNSSKEPDST